MNAARRILVSLAVLTVALLPPLAHADTPTPGDIPDNQAFVPLTGPGYQLSTPEGWDGRRATAGSRYGQVQLDHRRGLEAPHGADRAFRDRSGAAPLALLVAGFESPRVTTLMRPAGRVVLVRYQARSRRDAVTGKTVVNDVERYEFWKAGRLAA